MQVRLPRRDPTARGAHHEALLDQEGFDHVFDGAALLAERRREAFDADGAAVELLDDREQELAIHHVEAIAIDIEQIERGLRDFVRDSTTRLHLGVVADAA